MMKYQILVQLEPKELEDLIKKALHDYFKKHPLIMEQDGNSLMSITEAATFLNCSIPTIYNKVSKRKIPFHKQGKCLYFSKSELVKWIKHEI